jgi:putative glutamine amidotransferase
MIIGATCGDRLGTAYRRALEACGATVLELRAAGDDTPAVAAEPDLVLRRLDGLLLTGGGDVHPRLYGAASVHPTVRVDERRDLVETALCSAALGARVPLLAICRGVQLLNVACGGTLWQDIPSERPGSCCHLEPARDRDRTRPLHAVRVAEDGLLAAIVGSSRLPVNSIHHQGLRTIGERLRPEAVADDGLVEAVEAVDLPFAVGVQWHPEELTPTESGTPHRALFQAFCQAAERHSSRPTSPFPIRR